MKVIIEADLDESWATKEEWRMCHDGHVLELIWEDIDAALQNASYTVVRGEGEEYVSDEE